MRRLETRQVTGRIAAVLWSGGAVAIIAAAAVALFSLPLPQTLSRATPFDYTPTSDVQAWYFLQHAKQCLEPAATAVVLAPDPQQEHALYVLSVGVLDRNKPVAASYFGWSHPEKIAAARYVLVYRDTTHDTTGLIEVCKVPNGVVYERTSG